MVRSDATVLPWLVLLALVAANALYVAAEFAAVAAERPRIAQLAEEGNRRAQKLLPVIEDGVQLDRYIAACQIGITLSSLIAGAYGQATITVALAPRLSDGFDISIEAAASTAAIVVLLVLTMMQVVLGELLPKSLALQFPERTALLTFAPMRWSVTAFRGFIWLLNGSGFLLLRPFGVRPGGHQHVHSPEEIGIMIAESSRGGALSPEMSARLQRGLTLSERTVRDVMIPRDQIVGIEKSSSSDDVLKRVTDTAYSRVVVYDGTIEHVVGTVGVKDIVGHYAERGEVPALATVLRPLARVRASERADALVRVLQEQKTSKAIVVDDEDHVVGFVSIDDVLWELFREDAA